MSRESDISPDIIELLNQSQTLLYADSLLCQKNEPMFAEAIVVRFCFLQPKTFQNNTDAIYHNHSLSQQHAVGTLLSLQPEETATADSLMI